MLRYVFLLVLILTGCSVAPTQQEAANAYYGAEQTPEECTAAVEATVANAMKDPSSVQWRHGAPCFKGYWGSVPVSGLGIAYGYVQNGEINAKNSYGAYVGFAAYQALIQDGKVIRYCVTDKDGFCFPR